MKLDNRDFLEVFASETGARVLEFLDRSLFKNTSTFTEDPYRSAYYNGQRDALLLIHTMIERGKKNGRMEAGTTGRDKE